MTGEPERLAAASGDFLVALRERRGFRPDLYENVVAALRDCETAWSGSDCIPRSAVNVLVDMVPAVQAVADAYTGPEKQRIYDASFTLFDLIGQCVEVRPL
jgi:hypothetical protein